jgi:hypothetical protein
MCAGERFGMISRGAAFVARKTEPEKTEGHAAPRTRAETGKGNCWSSASRLTSPRFHITAAAPQNVVHYTMDTASKKAKNSLDRDTQKRDNGKWCVTN